MIQTSNHFKAQVAQVNIDVSADVFKGLLMASGFTFDRDAHATLADVSASELAKINGYDGAHVLANVDLTSIEDDTNDRSYVSWDEVSWTATGGAIGPCPGMIIYDDTTVDDTIVGYIDFTTERTVMDGNPFKVTSLALYLSNGGFFSNHALKMLYTGKIDLTSDTIKAVLMATGFTFNVDTHATYADISASELPNGSGYTTGGQTLTNVDVTSIEDDVNDRSEVSWHDISWIASGGAIGPIPVCLLVDTSTTDNTVIGISNDFGGDITVPDGETLLLLNPTVRIS